MSVTVWIMVVIGTPQIASLVGGLAGCVIGLVLSKTPLLETDNHRISPSIQRTPSNLGKHPNFHIAFMPYYLIILLSIASQIPEIKELGANLRWGLNYPATETSLGFHADSQESYANIKLLRHPAPIILVSLCISLLIFRLRRLWNLSDLVSASKRTYDQCAPTSVAAIAMLMMAITMTDTGMIDVLSSAIAKGTGDVFPIFSPYIGVLGTFMTGSNTNSNVMFGALQIETANALQINSVTIASIQSIGGSLGSAIAPAKVLVGTAVVGLTGREPEVLRKTLPYVLITVFLVGVQAWILVKLF
jgi:lactate permease